MNDWFPPNATVLGQTQDGTPLLWISDTRCIERVQLGRATRAEVIRVIGRDGLNSMAERMGDDGKAAKTSVAINWFLGEVAERARQRTLDLDETGRGICEIDGLKTLITGRDSYILTPKETEIAVHKLDTPLRGNRLLTTSARPWIEADELRASATRVAGDIPAVWSRLHDSISSWSFASPGDELLIVGMMIVTPLQALLPFRPHVWVTGPSNSGNSAMLELLHRVWPHAVRFDGASSEPSVRQKLASETLPVLLDEQEQHASRAAILKLFRSSTRGGSVFRGTSDQKGREFRVQHCAWMASISPGLTETADANRFIDVELRPSAIRLLDAALAAVLGRDALAAGLMRLPALLAVSERLGDAARGHGRAAETLAVPLAAAVAFGALEEAEATELLLLLLDKRTGNTDQTTDDQKLLDVLGGLMIQRFPLTYWLRKVTGERTLSAAEDAMEVLESSGFRPLESRGVATNLFIVPKRVDLRGTAFEGEDIRRLLLRVPGAEATAQRVHGQSLRGVVIPISELLGDLRPTSDPNPDRPLTEEEVNQMFRDFSDRRKQLGE